MAKLEIPSIVVHSGSPSVPGMSMDRSPRQTPQLHKQKSSLDDGDSGVSGCIHHSKQESSCTSPNGNSTNNNGNNLNSNPHTTSKSPETTSGGGSNSKPGSPGGQNSKNDIDKPSGPQPQLSRSRSNAKMKMLTRSHAMREATSPPPDPASAEQASASPSTLTTSTNAVSSNPVVVSNSGSGNGKSNSQASKPSNNNSNGSSNHQIGINISGGSGNNNNNHNNNNNNYPKNKNGNNKNKDQNSTSSNRPNQRQSKNAVYISSRQENWSSLLNRDSGNDPQYIDAAKADLDGFIAQQMSTKNRGLLLRVEEELIKLVDHSRQVYFRFPQMSSFHRMLVHRAATYYGLDHNLDVSGTCVVVNRNRNSKKPEKNFLEIQKSYKGASNRAYSSEEPRKSILKRDFASFEDSQYKDSTESCNQDGQSIQDSMEDVRWNECAQWSGDEPEPPGRYLRPNDRSPRLMKTESYDSRDSLKSNSARSAVSKSYSFGGYTGNGGNNGRHGQNFSGLQRGDSTSSSISTGSRMLSKQDSASSASSRLSPSSSGYKSQQSQQSDATLSATPSPTATPVSLPMSSQGSQDTLSPEPPVIWPLTALGNIPPGSVLMNPVTGQPICNADGSVYQYDPEHPLTLHVPQVESPPANNSSKQSDKGDGKNAAGEKHSPSTSPKATSSNASITATAKGASPPESSRNSPGQPTQPAKPAANTKASEKSDSAESGSKSLQKESQADGRRPRDEHRGKQDNNEGAAKSDSASAGGPSLSVPTEQPGRPMTNSSTSPMLVPSTLPPRPPLAQVGQPILVGGAASAQAAGAAAAAAPAPAGYSVTGSPMMAVPVMAAPGQLPYPVQGAAVSAGTVATPMAAQHYHNGAAPYGYAPAAAPDGHQAFMNGYHAAAVPYHVGGYPISVDPASYIAQPHQQPPQAAGQPAPPCCIPGYPCPYGGAGAPGAAPLHAAYEQRSPETGGQVVADMTNYMMGMSLNGSGPGGVDQRAGGDGVSAQSQSPQHGPQTPLIAGSYYWSPQLSSHNQGYPPVMYYYPPNNVQSPPQSAGSATPVAASSNSYNRGTSPAHSHSRDSGNKSNSHSAGASSNSQGGSNRNNYNRNVAASYAKGAAIYQPPVYSVPSVQVPPQTQDRALMNGYPSDCVAAPQQQVVYTVSSMHSSTVPTQSYQPAVYSSASIAASGTAPPTAITYYQGVQGAGDAGSPAQNQQLVPVNPYATPQGYIQAPGTPPLTPQASYGVHPYVYGMYSQTPNGAGTPNPQSTYPSGATHQSPMIQRMMRPNLSSPPPRNMGPKGFPRGQSPVNRKDQGAQSYSVPMYNLAASRIMSGDMRYMQGRLPFSIPTNNYHRAIRPFQTSYYPRPQSQPSGEALSFTRPTRVRKPT